MRVLACVICFMVLEVWSGEQPAKDVQVHHLSGTVVDENGQPVAEASIGHFSDKPNSVADRINLDASGRFSVEIRSPAIVIRKEGYKSVRLHAQDGDGVKVQLESLAKSGQSFPVCDGASLSDEKRLWPRFRLPESRELSMSKGSDVDYEGQIFRLKGVHGKNYLVHGWGPTWSFGVPLDEEVWNSVIYEERVFNMNPISVLDARGTLGNGTRWRLVASFGETLGYDGVNEKVAAAFDAILDRTCFQPAEKT